MISTPGGVRYAHALSSPSAAAGVAPAAQAGPSTPASFSALSLRLLRTPEQNRRDVMRSSRWYRPHRKLFRSGGAIA